MDYIKHFIEEDLWQYEFIETDTSYVITVLIHEDKALLIDTAYERHTHEVLGALKADGITAERVVVSHFHPDHCGGLLKLTDCHTIASDQYLYNWNKCKTWLPDVTIPHPVQVVHLTHSIEFGMRQLTLIEMGGHTTGHLVIRIDHDYIHMGDLLMRTASGLLSLPYLCDDGNLDAHQENLKAIYDMQPKGLLLAHGAPLLNEDIMKDKLFDALFYLKALSERRESDQVEAYLAKSTSHYGCLNFHENNLKFIASSLSNS